MKRVFAPFVVALLLVCFCMPLPAQEEVGEDEDFVSGSHYVVNFSLYHPVSLNKTRYDSVNLNLSLIYGRVGTLSGFDLSGVASVVSYRMQGVQICGLAAVVGQFGTGAQISGLVNVAGQSFSGFQASGLMNIAGQNLAGFQTAGLMNVAGQDGKWAQMAGLGNVSGQRYNGVQFAGGFNVVGQQGSGLQMSGLFNVVGQENAGLQASGLFNVVGRELKGVQIAGLFNVTGQTLKGIQIGTVNIAAESKGIQIGVANIGETLGGVQIGIVNAAKGDMTGFPFGMVNIADNGYRRWTVWGGNSVAVTLGYRFIIRDLYYSIISIGGVNLDDGISESIAYGFHYGFMFPAGQMEWAVDLGYRYRDNRTLFRNTSGHPDDQMFEARLRLGIPLDGRISLVLGAGGRYVFERETGISSGKLKPLFTAGLEF